MDINRITNLHSCDDIVFLYYIAFLIRKGKKKYCLLECNFIPIYIHMSIPIHPVMNLSDARRILVSHLQKMVEFVC